MSPSPEDKSVSSSIDQAISSLHKKIPWLIGGNRTSAEEYLAQAEVGTQVFRVSSFKRKGSSNEYIAISKKASTGVAHFLALIKDGEIVMCDAEGNPPTSVEPEIPLKAKVINSLQKSSDWSSSVEDGIKGMMTSSIGHRLFAPHKDADKLTMLTKLPTGDIELDVFPVMELDLIEADLEKEGLNRSMFRVFNPEEADRDLISALESRDLWNPKTVLTLNDIPTKSGPCLYHPSLKKGNIIKTCRTKDGKLIDTYFLLNGYGMIPIDERGNEIDRAKTLHPSNRKHFILSFLGSRQWRTGPRISIARELSQQSIGTALYTSSLLGKNYFAKMEKTADGIVITDYVATDDELNMEAVKGSTKSVAVVVHSAVFSPPSLSPSTSPSTVVDHSTVVDRRVDAREMREMCRALDSIDSSQYLFHHTLNIINKILNDEPSNLSTFFEELRCSPSSTFCDSKTPLLPSKKVVYGECHDDPTVRAQLIADLPDLVKKDGIATLGLEFFAVDQQALLDRYMTSSVAKEAEGALEQLRKELTQTLDYYGKSSSYLQRPNIFDVVTAAKKSGIKRIVALDHKYTIPLDQDKGQRIPYQNMVALNQLAKLSVPGGIVVLEGDNHVDSLSRQLNAKSRHCPRPPHSF
ncbi:MAG: hypothetical protein HQK51_20095 [Oligoflexia bacterium]|nr:hypothetical protein [Oligoflexia bacterium]